LLFLQTPLALSLLREHVPDLARFIQTELLTDYGLRTVPYEERGDGAEVILDAWYPHWDLYAVRLFRKTGQSAALLRWLSLAEGALERLGYCPEYLSLEGFRDGDPEAWKRHGAPSNLNCASGWYRAFLETLLGIELDPGGMTIGMVAPLRGEMSAHGLPFRRARWDIVVHGEGPSPARCLVDGVELGGVRKIPLNLCEPGRHRLEVVRGDPPDGIIVEELVNVELLHIVRARPGEVCLKIRPLGPGEVLVRSATPVVIAVDGSELPVRWDPGRGLAHAALPGPGAVEMTITGLDHSG
jgi:hypothetical protein